MFTTKRQTKAPKWRVVKDPHEETFAAEKLRLVRVALSGLVVESYETEAAGFATAADAIAWIEREKQRPIVVRTID